MMASFRPDDRPAWQMAVCDCHLHIYDPAFPYADEAGLRPPPATVSDYRTVRAAQGVARSVVVQPSSYGYDNRCTLAAVSQLGRERARAIVTVPDTIGDDELLRLDAAGARGVRLNLLRGATLDTAAVGRLAERIAPLGWHLQLHVDAASLPTLAPWLAALPLPVVLDHFGRLDPSRPSQDPSWQTLRKLLGERHIWIKLSAPYLLDPAGLPRHAALTPLVDMLLGAAPDRTIWGSDWPHPGWQAAGHQPLDELMLRDWAWAQFARHGLAQAVLADNPARLYGFD
jgi:D-galactarolactone isomerase